MEFRTENAGKTGRSRLPWNVTVALCGLTSAIWIFAPTSFLTGFLTLLVSCSIGLMMKTLVVVKSDRRPELLQILLDLARDKEVSLVHATLARTLDRLASQNDPAFRQLAMSKLKAIVEDCETLGAGVVEFTSTESWRVVYEELLRSPGLHLYRSIAFIESTHYWQDGPGQQSTKLNIELQEQNVLSVERTAIIADHLWPPHSLFPEEPLHSWLDEQHRHGIWLRLVRESALENDPDLRVDLGIYGSRAVGFQTADPAGRTIRFSLSFSFEDVQRAEVKWSRLSVYAISYRDLLDQKH